jgi:hypothetical protein
MPDVTSAEETAAQQPRAEQSQAPPGQAPFASPVGDPWSLYPDGGGPGSPSWQPRIVPSPKPSRRRIVVAAVLGLIGGLVLFGPTGYLVGHRAAPAPASSPAPLPSVSPLPSFERAQLELNKPHLPGELSAVATSWLPWITNCVSSGEKDGPRLGEGEQVRMACRYSNISVFFVRYTSTDDRDKAYTRYLGQNIDAKQLAPGVAEPDTRTTTSGTVNGRYVEYAFKSSADANAKTVCGMWWSDATEPIAAYLLAFWADGLGEKWEPLRDLWHRYS